MGELLGLLLIALASIVAGPILALVALRRLRAVERRVDELSELRNEVALLSLRVQQDAARRPESPVPQQAAAAPTVKAPPAPLLELDTDEVAAPVASPTLATPEARRISPRTEPAAPPSSPPSAVDWERWIGIRGAAVLGAVALGLAGLLFFKYSIEHGLITPAMRVVLGTFVGLGCLVGSGWLRRRDQRWVADGISGAGVVILYAAFWAAHALYGLIPMGAAFVLMILVTLACCAIAWRYSALIVAVIGLVGGFATPLMLSTDFDRPIGLFGYVLLLDLGLLTLGRKRHWPSLGVLSLLATVLIQALWAGSSMGPDRLVLGLIMLGVFSALFVLAARLSPDAESRNPWISSQTAAIFFPFAFAIYFAARTDLGPHLYPIAILMALLSAAACWISRVSDRYDPGLGAAGASVGVIGMWLMRHRMDAALSWETVGVLFGLAVLFHFFVELDRERSGSNGPVPSALISSGGASLLLLLAVVITRTGFTPWPWLAGLVALAVLLYRQASFADRAVLQIAGSLGVGAGLTLIHLLHSHEPTFPTPALFLALMLGATVTAHAVAMLRSGTGVRRFADHAAAALPMMLLAGLSVGSLLPRLAAAPALGTALMLGLLVALAATRLGSGFWYAAAVAATWFLQSVWAWMRPALADSPGQAAIAFGFAMASVVVLTAWPFLAPGRFRAERFAWYAAALAGPLWFMTLRRLFVLAFGDDFIGVLPVALALIPLVALTRVRKLWEPGQAMHLSALVWFAAVALGFVSIAIPLQLEKEWVTVGWALEGLAVLALWRRLDHPGLKYFGLALLGAASARLVFNPALLGYYPRSSVRVFNWLMYTYLVPAAALLGSAAILRPLELKRLSDRERKFYPGPLPSGAIAVAVAAVMVVFVWINLSIADWFSTGSTLTLSFGATAAQRLTVSIAWAVYGLILLSVGMARDIQGLRWLSLGFLLCTIGKVFLYDLGNLRDLYRVFSLVGLAASLLLVSFLYQRFVFRKAASGAS